MHPNDLNEELPQEYNPDQAYFKENVFFSWETVQRILLLISLPLTSMLVAIVIVSIMMNSTEPLSPVSKQPEKTTAIVDESSKPGELTPKPIEKPTEKNTDKNNNKNNETQIESSRPLTAEERKKEIEQTLQRCQLYHRTRRLISSSSNSDDNAFACYKEVLSLDKDNEEAKRGLKKLEETYIRRAHSALKSGGSVKRIESYIRQLHIINPNSRALPELERRLKSFQAVERDYDIGD